MARNARLRVRNHANTLPSFDLLPSSTRCFSAYWDNGRTNALPVLLAVFTMCPLTISDLRSESMSLNRRPVSYAALIHAGMKSQMRMLVTHPTRVSSFSAHSSSRPNSFIDHALGGVERLRIFVTRSGGTSVIPSSNAYRHNVSNSRRMFCLVVAERLDSETKNRFTIAGSR